MNSAFGQATASPSPASSLVDDRRTKVVLERLRNRLAGFALTDSKGKILGKVQDFQLVDDPAQRNFNVVFSPVGEPSALRLLHSRYLDRVETKQRSLITKLQSSQIQALPEYRLPDGIATQSNIVQPDVIQPDVAQSDSQSEQVQLLEERLFVNRSKRKVGEIVARKAIETRMVQVPVSREVLIVEQVGSSPQRLAQIDLGSGEVTGVQLPGSGAADALTVRGQFSTLQDAIALLSSIAQTIHHRCQQVNVETLLDGGQKTYHELPTPSLARQLPQAIAPSIAPRCQQVTLELKVGDREIQKTYQSWFEHYAQS